MQTLGDWAFVLGPLGGVVLVPMAWVVVNNAAVSARFKTAMTRFALALGLLIAAHWIVWWFSFETYQGETYTNDLFGLSTVLMYVSACGCLATYLAAGLACVLGRRSSQPQNA